MRLVLVRHAQSEWNAVGRWQGQADPPLTEEGRRQARALAREIADEKIELLVASDLARAAETAAILGEALGLEPRLDERFRELDVGDWTGLTHDEIAERDPQRLARFRAEDPDARPGGAESRREIRQRVRAAAADLAAAFAGRTVALVTHLGVIRALVPGTELPNAGWVAVRAEDLARPPSP